uniref:Uncharacterized protein n=1 Tax=Rhizophora mucronata TaxID=61149 RepID=A0A2P2P9Z2_RHIMU
MTATGTWTYSRNSQAMLLMKGGGKCMMQCLSSCISFAS